MLHEFWAIQAVPLARRPPAQMRPCHAAFHLVETHVSSCHTSSNHHHDHHDDHHHPLAATLRPILILSFSFYRITGSNISCGPGGKNLLELSFQFKYKL